MSTVGQISNGESGLSVRTKLNLVIDRTTVFDTAANFTSNNPTLNTGQLGIETDDLLTVPKFKIGDGANDWNTLPYFSSGGGTVDVNTIGAAINGAITATPNDTDLVMSVESSVAKKNTWTQVKAFLKTYFDTVYTTTASVATQITTALSSYVKKGTLTTNYIPKATASDTIGDSNIIDDGTNVGIGLISPTSKVHIHGADSTSSNYALKVDNSASSPLLYVRNDGNIGIGIIPTLSDVKLEIKVATNQRFLFRNFTYPTIGAALTLQNINDAAIDVTNVVTYGLDWYHASRNNLFSNTANIIVPTAKVHIIGDNNGSDLFALKVDNLASSPLLYVRNDGNVGIGTASPIAKLDVNGSIRSENLTASQIVETDASKNLVSASKGTAYNKNFGSTAGTVLEGDRIVQTITNGDTTHAPSGDVVFDMFKNHRQIYSSIRITQDSATITGTTSETLLASTLVPANTFSVDDVINLEIRCKRASATGNTSHRIKINTSNSLSGATLAGIVTNNNAVLMPTFSRNLCIKSSTYTEVMGTSATFSTDIGSITSAISSINIDWTIDQYIIISVQPSASAETNVLSYLLIERR